MNKNNNQQYNPIVSVRRDFEKKSIYFDKSIKRAVNKDLDLKQIMDFYNREVKPGTLLNLGAGPTHFHYMTSVQHKLTQITALDLSEKNIECLKEFLQSMNKNDKSALKEHKYVSADDVVILKNLAQASSWEYGKKLTGNKVLKSMYDKSFTNGQPDFIVGNMHDLGIIKNKKFDNILLSFSLYVTAEKELMSFFKSVYDHLEPKGKIVMVDFDIFPEELQDDQFSEDEIVNNLYPKVVDYSMQALILSLINAGFTENNINIKISQDLSDTTEKNLGTRYFLLTVQK